MHIFLQCLANLFYKHHGLYLRNFYELLTSERLHRVNLKKFKTDNREPSNLQIKSKLKRNIIRELRQVVRSIAVSPAKPEPKKNLV